MGEAKRTRQAAERLLVVPQPLRDEIAAEVAAIGFLQLGGTCLLRNVLAQQVIRARLGINVPVVIGGMIYRCGPDPRRDIVAFCGPDNRLLKWPGGIMGHYWLELAGVILDFSPPDWQRDAEILCAMEARQLGFDPGTMRFAAVLPAYVWDKRGHGIALPSGRGEPPLGRAYYTAEAAVPAEARDAITDAALIAASLAPYCGVADQRQEGRG